MQQAENHPCRIGYPLNLTLALWRFSDTIVQDDAPDHPNHRDQGDMLTIYGRVPSGFNLPL